MFIFQYLYYNQPKAIALLETIGAPDAPVHYLFVDDASAQPLQLNWPNATVLRITKNIPWNMPAANNLAFAHLVKQDPNAIVLRMDADHYFLPDQLPELIALSKTLQRKQTYHFARHNKTSHPNIYMAFVQDLIEAGGYNTAFCGNYGYDDKELMHRLHKKGFQMFLSNIIAHTNHKAGSHGLKRNTTINQKLYNKLTTK